MWLSVAIHTCIKPPRSIRNPKPIQTCIKLSRNTRLPKFQFVPTDIHTCITNIDFELYQPPGTHTPKIRRNMSRYGLKKLLLCLKKSLSLIN